MTDSKRRRNGEKSRRRFRKKELLVSLEMDVQAIRAVLLESFKYRILPMGNSHVVANENTELLSGGSSISDESVQSRIFKSGEFAYDKKRDWGIHTVVPLLLRDILRNHEEMTARAKKHRKFAKEVDDARQWLHPS